MVNFAASRKAVEVSRSMQIKLTNKGVVLKYAKLESVTLSEDD